MPHTNRDWLMVIDHQPAFSHPTSPWFTPGMDISSRQVARLAEAYGERALFTRFVPPETIQGSWKHYYDLWDFAHGADAAWLWGLDQAWEGRLSIASHTFSKWVPDAMAILGPHPSVTICGVSTDCCVLSTALAAVDGGALVRVVTDACAAGTPELHATALAILETRAPQLELLTTDQELARLAVGR